MTQPCAPAARQADGAARRLPRALLDRGRRYVALALDANGRRVDSRTSNMGHLLWSGLLTEDAADGVIRR